MKMTVKERKQRIGGTIEALAAVEESFRQVQEAEPDDDDLATMLAIRALKIAGAELQQRMPEKPTRIRSGKYSARLGDCPFCGRLVDSDGNYCKRCGKALDWNSQNAPN